MNVDDFSNFKIILNVNSTDGAIDFSDGVSTAESGNVNYPNAIALYEDMVYFQARESSTTATLYRFSLSSPDDQVEKVSESITLAASATFVNDCYVYIPQAR